MAEGEDLYDDLYEDVGDMLLPKAPFHESDTREEEFKKKEAELNGKVELLQKEVEALQQDKAILTRNISCLFKTAQMELARKDKQMKELREENLRFKLGGTRGPTNARPHLNKPAVPVDKANEQGKMTVDRNHYSSSTDEEKKRKSPSRGLLSSCNQHREIDSDSGRRTADDSSTKQKVSSSRSDRPRDGRYDDNLRHAHHGHSKCRSPESSRDRGRGRRVDDNLRNSDDRKRHRSLSRERDARPEDLESSRASKALNRSGSESSRERQNDHSSRYHR